MSGFTDQVKVLYTDVMDFINLPIKQKDKERTLVVIDEIDAVTKDYMAVMRKFQTDESVLVTGLANYLEDFTVFATSATADSKVIEVLERPKVGKPPRVFLDFTTLEMTKPSSDIDEVRFYENDEGTDEQKNELLECILELAQDTNVVVFTGCSLIVKNAHWICQYREFFSDYEIFHMTDEGSSPEEIIEFIISV